MLKTSVAVSLQEVRESGFPTIYKVSIPLSNANNMVLLLRSLYYRFVDRIRLFDEKTKTQLFLKYGDLAYHTDANELNIGIKELEQVEKLLLDYINGTYFLGLHTDLEVPAGKETADFTITVQI